MNLALRHNGQIFHIVRAADPRAGEIVRFTSVDDARSLVSRLATDERNRSVMRTAMQREALGLDTHRLGDKQVAEQFSRQLVHGRLRLAEDVKPPEAPASVSLAGGAAPDDPAPAPKKTRQKVGIKFKVIDDRNGRPISGVRLLVTHPDGEQNYYTTVGSGMVEINGLDPGKCEVTCSLKDARLADTLDFVALGDKPPVDDGTPAPGGSSLKQIAEVEAHKVKKGESILSLATAAGMKWQDLAKFNWGTDVPDEINKHLRDEVGCTKKTKDGYNYMFDDSDNPGIVYIPTPWVQTGLATESTHIFRVKPPAPVAGFALIIPVEMDPDDDPDQDDQVRIRTHDGQFDRMLACTESGVERDEERRLFLYNFGRVPVNEYVVSVRVGDQWIDVLYGLEVTPAGTRLRGRTVSEDLDNLHLGVPDDPEDARPEDRRDLGDPVEGDGIIDEETVQDIGAPGEGD